MIDGTSASWSAYLRGGETPHMRWPMRSTTEETSLAVERPARAHELAAPLPSVSLDDLMARLWIAPSTPEPALPMALGSTVSEKRPSRARRPRQSRQLREQRRRPTTTLAFDH